MIRVGDAVIPVPVFAPLWYQIGEPVHELERRALDAAAGPGARPRSVACGRLGGELADHQIWLVPRALFLRGPGGVNLVAGPRRSYNRDMLSQETLAAYRRMTPGQRLELTFELIRENTPYLLVGEPELVRRRFELLERENTLRDERIVAALAKLPRCTVPAHD